MYIRALRATLNKTDQSFISVSLYNQLAICHSWYLPGWNITRRTRVIFRFTLYIHTPTSQSRAWAGPDFYRQFRLSMPYHLLKSHPECYAEAFKPSDRHFAQASQVRQSQKLGFEHHRSGCSWTRGPTWLQWQRLYESQPLEGQSGSWHSRRYGAQHSRIPPTRMQGWARVSQEPGRKYSLTYPQPMTISTTMMTEMNVENPTTPAIPIEMISKKARKYHMKPTARATRRHRYAKK